MGKYARIRIVGDGFTQVVNAIDMGNNHIMVNADALREAIERATEYAADMEESMVVIINQTLFDDNDERMDQDMWLDDEMDATYSDMARAILKD